MVDRIDVPVLMAYGEFDELSTVEATIDLYDKITAPKRLLIFEQEFHALGGVGAELIGSTAAWLELALAGEIPPDDAQQAYVRRCGDIRDASAEPYSAAFSGVVTKHMDAASFCPLAFPAVTVASGSCSSRTGLSLLSDSTVVSARGCSSASISSSPLRLRTVTGMISSARMPSFCAATARWCEATASSSCSCREMLYSRRRFSAVSNIPPGTG